MTAVIRALVGALLLAGLLATGVLGTETRLLMFWPGCALVGLAALTSLFRWRWRMRTAPSDLCLASALIFGLYFLLRQINSPVRMWAREDLFILLACGVAYILTATVLSNPRWRNGLVLVLFLVLLGNLAVGFIHFSGRWTFHIVPGYMRSFGEGEAQRIGGFFINPNHLGAFLAMMTMLALGLAAFGGIRQMFPRLLLVFLAMAAALGAAKTGSRGAMIGLAVGALALAVMALALLRWTRPHLLAKAALAVAAAAGISAVLLGAVMTDHLEKRFAGSVPREDPRAFIWRSALAQHAEHPWLGAGARMFYEGCVRLRPADAPTWMKDAQFAHNEWLQALADYGWVGLLLVAAVFSIHLANGWKLLRWFALERFPRTASLGGERLGMVVGAMAALMAALAHAAFDFHFHVPAVAVTAAVFLGILANPGVDSPVWRPVRIPVVRLLSKLGLLGAGAAMLWSAFIVGRADFLVEKARLFGRQAETGLPDLGLLGRALDLDPLNAQSWHERGLALLDAAGGKPAIAVRPAVQLAVADLERSLELNPFDPYPSLALADAYDVLGRYEDAEERIRDAHRAAPLFEAPRLALAIHCFRLQQWERAEEAFLWAQQARAGRTSNEWFDLYRQMLRVAMAH